MNLRPFADSDLELMKLWLVQPHVAAWFPRPEAWIREIELRDSEYSYIRHFILEDEGQPIGFCQYYDYAKGGENWHGTIPAKGSYSVDYLIGDTSFLGRGCGAEVVRLLIERIRQEAPAERIIVRPEWENLRSRRTLLAAGAQYDGINDVFFFPGDESAAHIVRLSNRHELLEEAAAWFASKWSIPMEAYRESISDSFSKVVPSWYLYREGSSILGGMGVIENDFHNRPELTPNVCAVFTEPSRRNQGIAGMLLRHICEDMRIHGIDTLYLLTDLDGFYERCGWEFFSMVQGDGEEEPSRMYIHRCRK